MYSSDNEDIPRKITHLKTICRRGKECTVLTNGIQNNCKIHNFKNN